MKVYVTIILITVIGFSCTTPHQALVSSSGSTPRSEYILTYKHIAIEEMHRTGIPASIKMAQAILESGNGNSRLAREANNHFGIKCHGWSGRTIYHDDDELNECFRSYSDPEDSFKDHSEFLTSRPRYSGLFDLNPIDYKAWARGLKAAGYATNPNYDNILIRIIEENDLASLDSSRTISSGAVAGIDSESTREIVVRNNTNYIIANLNDSYESLTAEFGLMSWEIKKYNELPDHYTVGEGDIIYLQPKRLRAESGNGLHTVSEGETLWEISQKYAIRINRLERYNSIEANTFLKPGTRIKLRRGTIFPGGPSNITFAD